LIILAGALTDRGEASAFTSEETVTDAVQVTGAADTCVRFTTASARDVALQALAGR
jgi:hypothetical protein